MPGSWPRRPKLRCSRPQQSANRPARNRRPDDRGSIAHQRAIAAPMLPLPPQWRRDDVTARPDGVPPPLLRLLPVPRTNDDHDFVVHFRVDDGCGDLRAWCGRSGARPRKLGGGSDLVVYKDQLQEIDRDRAAGLIGEAEAEAARLEVSRRLLAAADTQPPSAAVKSSPPMLRRRRAAVIAALIILPFGAPSLYVALGSPNIPWEPAFARVNTPPGPPVDRKPRQQSRSAPCAAIPMMAPAGK